MLEFTAWTVKQLSNGDRSFCNVFNILYIHISFKKNIKLWERFSSGRFTFRHILILIVYDMDNID